METPQPVTLSLNGIQLEPLAARHEQGLREAAADGGLWGPVFTSVPEPEQTAAYIQTALTMPGRLAFAVIDEHTGKTIGSTGYHDINEAAAREKSATLGMPAATGAPAPTPPANTCCCTSPLKRWAHKPQAGAPTYSTPVRSRPLRGWAHKKTASYAASKPAATAAYAIP